MVKAQQGKASRLFFFLSALAWCPTTRLMGNSPGSTGAAHSTTGPEGRASRCSGASDGPGAAGRVPRVSHQALDTEATPTAPNSSVTTGTTGLPRSLYGSMDSLLGEPPSARRGLTVASLPSNASSTSLGGTSCTAVAGVARGPGPELPLGRKVGSSDSSNAHPPPARTCSTGTDLDRDALLLDTSPRYIPDLTKSMNELLASVALSPLSVDGSVSMGSRSPAPQMEDSPDSGGHGGGRWRPDRGASAGSGATSTAVPAGGAGTSSAASTHAPLGGTGSRVPSSVSCVRPPSVQEDRDLVVDDEDEELMEAIVGRPHSTVGRRP